VPAGVDDEDLAGDVVGALDEEHHRLGDLLGRAGELERGVLLVVGLLLLVGLEARASARVIWWAPTTLTA
jgi:hypothetical protein